MITNEGLSHDIEFLLDTLNRLNEGTVKPELVRRVIEDIGKESERPPVTVIRGLPEPEVSTNLIEERKRLLGEVYIKLAEIRSKDLAERRRKEQNINTLGLPTELNTDRAKKYFTKAEKMGYLERTNAGYKSKFRTKALLAYFLELVFCRDDNNKNNCMNFPETALNELFQEKRLGKARWQLYNNGSGKRKDYKAIGKPRGHEIVDEIFD